MKNNTHKAIRLVASLVSCFVLVVGLLVTPAVASSERHVYDVGTPKRTYNSDNTVTISYDVLSPMMGVTDVSDPENPVFISLKNNVTFSQTIDFVEAIEFTNGMSAYSYYDSGFYGKTTTLNGVTVYYVGLSDTYGGSLFYESQLPENFNAVLFNGEVYDATINTATLSTNGKTKYYIGNPALFQYTLGTIEVRYLDENGNALRDNGLDFGITWFPGEEMTIYTSVDFWIKTPGVPIIEFGSSETITELAPEHYALELAIAPFTTDQNVGTVFDLTNIKTSYGYDITFDFELSFTWGGALPEVPLNFYYTFYDSSFDTVLSSYEEFSTTLKVGQEKLSLTVPEGARYIHVTIAPASSIDVSETTELNISLNSFIISSTLTASENSDLMDTENNNQVNDKLDDIISGGDAGDGLNNATDSMDKDNDALGGALDDYHGAVDQLPTTPDNFDDAVDKDNINVAVNNAILIFDWNASGLTYMFVPMGISLSLAVLFYVVFGKRD